MSETAFDMMVDRVRELEITVSKLKEQIAFLLSYQKDIETANGRKSS